MKIMMCEFCCKKFEAERVSRRFCSVSCSSKWHYKEGFNLGFQKGHGTFEGSEQGWFTTMRVSGEKNVNYKDGSRCGEGYPKEFKIMRKELLKNEYMCQICKVWIFNQTSSRHLCVHHKDRDIYNNKLNNLVVLCNSCHQKLHRELEGLRR